MLTAVLAMSGGAITIDLDATLLLQAVVFAALVVVLKPLLFDPMLKVFDERERRTEGARHDARRMQAEASQLLQEYEQALDRVRRAASDERDRIRSETAKLEADILAEAHRSAACIAEEGRTRIASEIAALEAQLSLESDRIGREMAARVLGREIRG
jgi:F-type H+-transporting ATPase subunit b